MTRVSLTASTSPGSNWLGRSRIVRSSKRGVPCGRTTRSRAESRGSAGRSAMRPGGRSKSKRATRITWFSPASGLLISLLLALRSCSCAKAFAWIAAASADSRGNDPVRVADGLAALDLIDILHSRYDLCPAGILLVQKARVGKTDEELRVGGIWILLAGHRAGAAHMRLGIKLGLEIGIFRAAGSRPVRTARLRHKSVDHAMERDAIVELLCSELLDMRDMGWGEVGPHFDDDGPLRSFESERVTSFGHAGLLDMVGGLALPDTRLKVNQLGFPQARSGTLLPTEAVK